MTTVDQLLASARQRAADNKLAYAGAFTPTEAFEFLQQTATARMVDVRTRAELEWIGRPALDNGQYLPVEWNTWPGAQRNPDFLRTLEDCVADRSTPVLLLCRSAARSKAAAIVAAQAGFTQVFDVLEGFEGDKDAHGHRKTVSGWCFRGLPWIGA